MESHYVYMFVSKCYWSKQLGVCGWINKNPSLEIEKSIITTNCGSAASFLHAAKIIEMNKRKEKYDLPFSKNLKSDIGWEVWGS